MMMKNFLKYIALSCLMISAGCSYDMGNYEYVELDEPIISGVGDYSVLTYTRLNISPVFGEGFHKEAYNYEWCVLDNNSTSEPIILGTEPILDIEVSLTPGSYTLYYTLTEKATGIFWRKESTLVVNSSTSEGWMVLCSDKGRTRLDFVSEVTDNIYRDILASGGMPQWNGPRKIQWLTEKTDAASPFYLFTDEGATRLGKDSFEWKPEYDFSYEVASQDVVLPYSMVSAGFGKVVVSAGKAYYCEVMGFDGLYGSAVNKDFIVSEYVGTNVLATQVYAPVHLLYDTDNKKMLAYCPLLAANDLGGLEPVVEMDEFAGIAEGMQPGAGMLGDAFKDWPQGYDLVYMENTRYDPGNAKMGMTYVILKDGERCLLYGVQLGDLLCYADCTYVIGKGLYADLTSCADILGEGNLYAFSSLKNYMYYAAEGSVYRVNLSEPTSAPELQFTLSGEDITMMKFNLYQNSDNASRSYDLVIGSLKDGNGRLRVYEGLQADGDFRNVTPVLYEGFAEIVDATYKERIY